MRFGLLTVVLALSTEGRAQNVNNVNLGTTYPTIQLAVDVANPGDTLELVAPSFTETVGITKDIAIFGNGLTS